MATRKPLFYNASEFGPEEMAADDDIALGGLAMSGDITMGTNEVTGLPATPSGPTAATSKSYVDALINGLHPQPNCRVATTADLIAAGWTVGGGPGLGKTLTSPNSNVSNNDFDGITLVAGDVDRILVKDGAGANATSNGIYTMTTLADGAAQNAVITRAIDFDEDVEAVAGSHTFVTEGTAHEDTGWLVTTDDPIVVDTTQIDWAQFSSAIPVTGGQGIDVTIGVVSVDLSTNPGLQFTGGAPNGTLGLLVAASQGLALTASGLETVLATLGALAKGAGGLSVAVDGTSVFITNPGNVLEARLGRLEEDHTANENVALGDPIEWSAVNNEMRQCRANAGARVDCFGVVQESGGISAAGSGRVVRRGVATGVLVGATAGDRYYVDNTGGLVQGAGTIAAGNHVIFVGTAKNVTDLEVNPQYITRKAA